MNRPAIFPSLLRTRTPKDAYDNRYIIALTVTLASVLELIDTSIVIVAVPHMMGSLGATLDEIAWVSTGYVVANVIVLPISGWLSGQFGRRNYFALSILIFTLASIMCGTATSLGGLVFWRIIQGLGGGGLISTAQAGLYEIFPPKEVGTAMAIFGFGIMVGPTLGPTIGGYITDMFSWPWIFYINIPLGCFALLFTLTYLPDSRFEQPSARVDYTGLLLLAAGIGALQLILERGERQGWFESSEIVVYVLVSTGSLAWFVQHELRESHPVVDLHILKDVQFAASLLFTFVLGGVFYSTVFVLPVFMQTVLGYTAKETGLTLLPGALVTGITMGVMGRVVGKISIDMRMWVVMGVCIFWSSMLLHSQLTGLSGNQDLFWPVLLRGLGLGMIFIPINNLALGNLSAAKVANGSGLYNLTRQLGGSVGIALSATLFGHLQDLKRGELIQFVTQYNDAAMARLASLKTLWLFHGAQDLTAHKKALLMLNSQVQDQAAVLSFEQLFIIFAFVLSLALPSLFLIRRVQIANENDPMH